MSDRKPSVGFSTKFSEFDGEFDSHDALYKYSIGQTDEFWGRCAISRLSWYNPPTTVSNCNMKTGDIKWFEDGSLNVCVNCVDRHLETKGDQAALIWERDDSKKSTKITYRELHEYVCRFSNVLKDHGVVKGDRVAIYLPVGLQGVAAMLACARIGAVHSVIFTGFSAQALAHRMDDAECKILLAQDFNHRGSRVIDLKKIVLDATALSKSLKTVLMYTEIGSRDDWPSNYHDLASLISAASTNCPAEVMNAEDPLFMLYTSGSTGKPKGLLHTTAGYLLYAEMTVRHVFDFQSNDVFGCVADIGWITGHTYVVYGPLANGGTTLCFDSHPLYPDAGRYWDTCQKYGVTQFYGAPTAYRMLLRQGNEFVTKYDLSTLRVIGSVGEPINVAAWTWLNEIVGSTKCDIVDTWWQTETGGNLVTPRPSNFGADIKPGMAMRSFYGIEAAICDPATGKEIEWQRGMRIEGALCFKKPWPGMARTIYGNNERFFNTYYKPFPGMYFSGDGAIKDAEGYIQITGRMDDVINISGHRLGTAEIEDVLNSHALVSETAVIGIPHDIKGESAVAFTILKCNVDPAKEAVIRQELIQLVRNGLAKFAAPEKIYFVEGLPKTRSGKIMRRILRKISADQIDEIGDTTTLADPAVVEDLIQQVAGCKAEMNGNGSIRVSR